MDPYLYELMNTPKRKKKFIAWSILICRIIQLPFKIIYNTIKRTNGKKNKQKISS